MPGPSGGRKPCPQGQASLSVKSDGTDSTVCQLSASYPVKLIAPNIAHDRRAVLAFILSYGGGLVPGDRAELNMHVHKKARLGLLTQGSTKIYKSLPASPAAVQNLTVTVAEDAALLLLPDPIQPFWSSTYKQHQIFRMHQHASLIFLDWVSEGRRTMGESWSLTSFCSKNEVWRIPDVDSTAESGGTEKSESEPKKSRLLLRDNMILGNDDKHPSGCSAYSSMNGMGIFGTLVIGGVLFQELGVFFLQAFAKQPRVGEKNWSKDEKQQEKVPEGLLWTAASVRGFTVVKFGAKEVDVARRWLRDMLTSQGTIAQEFGSRFLLCLQDR